MNQFYVQPPQFGQGLQSLAGSVDKFQAERKVEATEQAADTRKQAAQKALMEAEASGDPRAYSRVAAEFPEIREQAEKAYGFTSGVTKEIAREGYSRAIATKDPVAAGQIIRQTAQRIQEAGGRPVMTAADAEALESGDPEALRRITNGLALLTEPAEFEAIMGGGASASSIGQFNPRDYTTQSFAKFMDTGDPSVLERFASQQSVDIGGVPHVFDPAIGGYKPATVAGGAPVTAGDVAGAQAQIEGAKEGAKLQQQLAIKPRIEEAVKAAEAAAASRGESLSELKRAEAALPGIKEVVNKLMTLSDVATYTEGGKVFDEMVKQLGFGATEGATARAQMKSIVDNQVLPLLRDTFGAAFTASEGERLTKTLMDIDASPETKKAQLNTFIEQKMRDIETKRATAEQAPKPAAAAQPADSGNVVDWSDL